MLNGVRPLLLMLLALCAAGLTLRPEDVSAQDLDARKSPQQLFSSNCAACHRRPQGLASRRNPAELPDFLRKHYTTGSQSAVALARYLASVRAGRPSGLEGEEGASQSGGSRASRVERRVREEQAVAERPGVVRAPSDPEPVIVSLEPVPIPEDSPEERSRNPNRGFPAALPAVPGDTQTASIRPSGAGAHTSESGNGAPAEADERLALSAIFSAPLP